MLQFWARFLTEADRTLWRTTPWGTQWGQLDDLAGLASSVKRSLSGRLATSVVTLLGITTSVYFGGRADAVWSSGPRVGVQDSYLVDSASSHMLVSKIKPCMSKYKQLYRETANGSLNRL